MVLEPHRSQYLRAIGVEVYVPRWSLPGAAESQPMAWADESEVVVEVEAELPVAVGRAAAEAPVARPAVPEIEIATRRVARPPEPALQEQPRSDGPRFSLLIVRCATGIVVVDEGPRGDQRLEEYLRLLGNLLFALYRQPVAMEADQFVWPMRVKNPQVDRSEQAARESLGANLQRQCLQAGGNTLLTLGSGATQWFNDDPDFRLIAGISLWRCLADGGAKQTLWQQLQPLRVMRH